MKRFLIWIIALSFFSLASCALPTGDNKVTEESTAGEKTIIASDDLTEEKVVAEATSGGNNVNGSASVNATVMMPVTLYYQDADGYLIPMTRWVEKQPGIANAAISGLIDSAVSREELQYYGVYPVLPLNTDVLGINIKDGLATIDFSKQLLSYESADIEKNIVKSLVYTLTEFPSINSVKILINGYGVDKMKYGTDISRPIGRSELAINSNIEAGIKKAEIFCFKKANEGFVYVLPVSVDIESSEDLNAGSLIKLLLKGINSNAIQSEIPLEAKLQSYKIKNGILALDFNNKFLDYGGSSREEGILKQIAYTVKQLKGISLIILTIDGKRIQLPEGTDVSQGIAVPKTINDFIDR